MYQGSAPWLVKLDIKYHVERLPALKINSALEVIRYLLISASNSSIHILLDMIRTVSSKGVAIAVLTLNLRLGQPASNLV